MYPTILLALDTSPTDRAIIEHVKSLAAALHSHVVLLHVATGVQAKWAGPAAAGEEVNQSQAYLNNVQREFQQIGVATHTVLCYGESAPEIVKFVESNDIHLIAMGTHGHRLLGDILHGFTASKVQHRVSIPVLLLRSK
ncbi:MAG: universal stress protein [Phycisphaeraceae bacterium]